MTTDRQLLLIADDKLRDFGRELRTLSRLVQDDPGSADIPKPGNPAAGKAWLETRGVSVLQPATGVSFYYQTVQDPCIVIPPFELLRDPVPPMGYSVRQFYKDKCAGGGFGTIDLDFYLRRLADYTLTHCGD